MLFRSLFAPLMVVLGRLVQGLSAGVELGGASVYLSEIATPGNRGFYVSWQSGSQQVAVIFASFIGLLLSVTMKPEEMQAWGFRIPLLVGSMMIPFVMFMRRSLEETEDFLKRKHHPGVREILQTVGANWRLVVLGMMLSIMTTVTFYMITAYMPTYGNSVLKFSQKESMLVTLIIGLSNFILLPTGGICSDRFGRRKMLAIFSGLALVTAYPILAWLVSAPSVGKLILAGLWFSMISGGYNGSMVVYLVELMPAKVRASGFSLAFALAAGIFGGLTPAVSTYLIHVTGNRAIPGVWLSFAALMGLIATAALGPNSKAVKFAQQTSE